MADYFTADNHFGHRNIIKYCNRPFESLEEMDAVMVERINERVTPKDRLFVLGDFSYRAEAQPYLAKINCKNVWLIKGNHDKRPTERDGFTRVLDYYEDKFDIGGEHKPIVLFHYPLLSWNQSHRGSWHLYGHVHGTISGDRGLTEGKYCIDVGVDCHNFYPVSLAEICWLMSTIQWRDPFFEEIPEEFREALAELGQSDSDISSWWRMPNEAFGGLSPKKLIESDNSDKVWSAIHQMRTGHPS